MSNSMDANHNKKINFGRITILIIILFGAIGQVFPLIWMIDSSLLQNTEIYNSGILKIPNPPQWLNYKEAWIRGHILKNFTNSCIVAAVTILIVVVLSIMLGYVFTRMEWKLRGLFLSIILLALMIPVYSTLLPNFKVYHDLGMLNTLWVLILPYAAFNLPTGVFIMTGFLDGIPKSLEEAAVIDGCGIYGIIFRIIAPITKPAIVTIIIMTFIACWNEFIMAVTYITKEQYKTLPFSIWEFAGQYVSQYSKQFAVFTLATLPVVIIYFFLNEQITSGVTAGAVKG